MRRDEIEDHAAATGRDQRGVNRVAENRVANRLGELSVDAVVNQLLCDTLGRILSDSEAVIVERGE